MYIEFVIIYIALFIIAVMLGLVIFLLVKLTKANSGARTSGNYYSSNSASYGAQGYNPGAQQYSGGNYAAGQQYAGGYGANAQQYGQNNGIVFCKNCATQYDSSRRACPKCGTPR